jgi:hypothetical protein
MALGSNEDASTFIRPNLKKFSLTKRLLKFLIIG